MSHRIVDDFAVARFPATTLTECVRKPGFYADHFMFFELGGDNNLLQYSNVSHREVRCRSWNLIAVGQEWEIMRRIVTFAASCEGGGMRFNGERRTQAESYVRKARHQIAEALPAKALYETGLSCTASIEVDLSCQLKRYQQERVQELQAVMPAEEHENRLVWTLHPIIDPKHAAIMFAFYTLDEREIYNQARVAGREYAEDGLMRRARTFRKD